MGARKICAALLSVAFLTLAAPGYCQLAPGGWSKFRGNARNTGLSSQTGPDTAALGWTYATGGAVAGSPAIAPDAAAYVSSQDGYLYCVNPDGSLRWRYNIANSTSYSSPAIGADGVVYVGSDDFYVYAVNPNGTLKWRRGFGKKIVGSPAIGADGRVYVGTWQNRFHALAPSDGATLWTYTVGNPISSSAAIDASGNVYFTCNDGYLYSLTSSGSLRWRYRTFNYLDSSPAVGNDGVVYFGGYDGYLYAINPDGTLKWRYNTGSPIKSSPAIAPDGSVYIGSDDGRVYAIRTNGTLSWSYQTGGAVQSSPACGSDGSLYVGSMDGHVYAITAGGALLWRHALGGAVFSSPAISDDGTLYVGSHGGSLFTFSKDRTPPTTPVVIDDGAYTTSADTLHASWSSQDPETGVAEYRYAIGTAPGSADLVDWTSAGAAVEVTLTGLPLANGVTYYFSVKARNGAHLWSDVGTSDGITVDRTPPTVPAVVDDGAYTASLSALHASWSAADPESGIAEYEYAIGTAPGAANVVGWTSVGAEVQVTRAGLSLVNGAVYYFAVRARNNAGLWSDAGTSDGITVDSTPPSTPLVADEGDFTASLSQLFASWQAHDPQSGIANYQYAIGSSPGATDVRGWTSAGAATGVTASGLALVDGGIYYFSVRAQNGSGLLSEVGVSDGITVDVTPPTTPVVVDEGAYTASADTLWASWSAQDAQSGIAEYEFAIGTSPGASDTRAWTSVGGSTQVSVAGLSLEDGGEYYFAVRARNRAGTWSAVGTSDGIMADSSAPTTPAITDGGDYTTSADTLHASWNSQDPHSGISEYQYAIGTSPGSTNVAGWTSIGAQTQVTRGGLSLSTGATYYFAVRARNGAGLWSQVGLSDGITCDRTPPQPPSVTDDGEYTSNATALHASWATSDPESGIAEYQYAIGTSPGSLDVVGWTSVGTQTGATHSGLALISGSTYYVAVRARNGAGLWSSPGVSDGIKVDTTAPGLPTVYDDGDYTDSSTSLHASWSAIDPESGVAEYQYAIGTTPGGTNTRGWTSTGALAEVTALGLSLVDGWSYYFSVRARNGAGLWSAVGTSDGITVDATPPTTPAVTDDGAYTSSSDTLHAAWSAQDPHSGVAEFHCAIGTSPGSTDLLNWTSAGVSTQISRTGLPLINGATYYFAVKARNRAGGWSGVGTSDGILVDWTPPITPSVIHDASYTSSTTTLSASWTADDPQSGVVEIQYAIGSTPGATNIVNWTSVGTQSQVTRGGLSLSHAATYYFAVRARNPLGMWSSTGVSGGITVDTTAPVAPVVVDEGDYTASFDSLHASWAAQDPESGVSEYTYAIGTTPGANDVMDWTPAGSATEVTAYGLSLVDGTTYYFSVRARNGAGLWGPMGFSDGITVAVAISWPKFRGDSKNRGYTGAVGCGQGTLAWEFATQGWVESSAAIAGDGTIYFGSGDGSMYALGRNGNILWRYETGGPIDSSPAIGKAGRIYFGSYDGYLYCLNPNGTLRWRYLTGNQIWSSPVIGPDDVIYIGSQDGYAYAIRDSGELKWRFYAGGAVWSSPALDGGVLYFGSGDGYIYAVYTSSGARKWRYYTGTAVDSSPAVGQDGTVYAGSGDGYLYALNPEGTLRWRYYIGWGAVDSSAAIGGDGTIYVGAGHELNYGFLYAFDPNGGLKWLFDAQGGVRSSPSVGGDGTIYFGSGDGHIYAVTAGGQLKWRYQTGWAVFASPAIGRDGSVYAGSFSGYLYAFKDSTVVDPTPPSKPVVTDEGAATLDSTALSAWWSSSDPESGVTGYMYAIGKTPGASDAAAWTSTGTSNSVTRTGLKLSVGSKYYVSVKARNGAGLWSQVGSSDGIVVVAPDDLLSVGEAQKRPDGSLVYLDKKLITARFDGSVYVQEPDRSAGIRVLVGDLGGAANNRSLSVAGTMTTVGCERAISPVATEIGGAMPSAAPFLMPCCQVGWGPGAGDSGAASTGLRSLGLLAAAVGRVVSVGADCFYIDDGTVSRNPNGASALKVSAGGTVPPGAVNLPPPGALVRVVGICSMEAFADGYRPVLRPRSGADVQVIAP